MKTLKQESGFTLIELLLAMTVFSFIMIIATVGFIGMNRTFNRGIIRKQLSESTQSMNESISRSIRAQPTSASIGDVCINVDGNCVVSGYNTLSFNGSCYFWKSDDSEGGLYYSNACGDGANTGNSTVIVDSRYILQTLTVSGINNNPQLYSVRGVLRTNNAGAFVDINANPVICKGSVEALSQTCAVENFAYTINSRGGQL